MRRLACILAAAVAVSVLLAFHAHAQTVPPAHPAFARHEAALRAEAAAALLDAYERAGAETRAAIEKRLAPRRGPLLGWPNGASLAAARRIAEGTALEGAGAELERLADSLDVMVVPGVSAAALADGRPAPSSAVRIWPRWTVDVPADELETAVLLIDAAGAELEVRRASVAAAAFRRPGFDLFMRPPAGPPTPWRLVVELRLGDQVARTAAVGIETVADLDARREALLRGAATNASFAAVLYAAELDALLAHGVRAAHGMPAEALLDGWHGFASSGTGRSHFPVPLAEETATEAPAAFPRAIAWRVLPRGDTRALLVAFAPPTEDPGALLRGGRGARWRDLADRRGLELIFANGDAEHAAGLLRRALDEALERELPLVVVIRAGAALAVHLALAGLAGEDDWHRAAPLVATVLPGAPSLVPGGVGGRALVVAPGVVHDLVGAPDRFATSPLGAVPLLDDATWPERLAAWFDARDGDGGSGSDPDDGGGGR